ncbi:glycerate kinase [Microbacterium sp. NPDC055910]|uniref:glycerate kinase n=1 Tax=Microbacterium sp. NPDC055910 TaxID=3345659 RepID=UPI0035DE0DA2
MNDAAPSRDVLNVVVATDSFKGTFDARAAADSIARGWRSVRPDDAVLLVPQADGGEGTLDALAASMPAARWVETGAVTGPDGSPARGRYLLLADGTACVELALTSGLPLMRALDPVGATTRGVGEVIAQVLADGARSVLLGLGGSASTDGGAGALAALGLRLLDERGRPVVDGAGGLLAVRSIDRTHLIAPPPGGIRLLCDVTAPLLGPRGAAATFGPQKGATQDQIAGLERALLRLADAAGASDAARSLPGAGAAGGTAFGFTEFWGATIEPGAATISRLTGLDDALTDADVVVTGEGRFDATSLTGKVVGAVLASAGRKDVRAIVVAGSVRSVAPGATTLSLCELAGGETAAMRDPGRWLEEAAMVAAGRTRR